MLLLLADAAKLEKGDSHLTLPQFSFWRIQAKQVSLTFQKPSKQRCGVVFISSNECPICGLQQTTCFIESFLTLAALVWREHVHLPRYMR